MECTDCICSGLWVLWTRNTCIFWFVRMYKYWDLITLWCYWHIGQSSFSVCGADPYIKASSQLLSASSTLLPLLLQYLHTWTKDPGSDGTHSSPRRVENHCVGWSPPKGSPKTQLKRKAAHGLLKNRPGLYVKGNKNEVSKQRKTLLFQYELEYQRILRLKIKKEGSDNRKMPK